MQQILVVNSGSSTLKFKLFQMPDEEVIAQGMVDRLGSDKSVFEIKFHGQKQTKNLPIKSHAAAVDYLMKQLLGLGIIKDIKDISGIGHRVVSGGPVFDNSIAMSDDNLSKLAEVDEYAPLHNPAERKGIEAFNEMLPGVPQVAVFDTSFYRDLPEMNKIYSIPRHLDHKYGAHKYGAHGTSHHYVSDEAAKLLNKNLSSLKMITLHMGSGVSVTAEKDGKAFDTSMGFTPISGVTMSSRAGDVDVSLVAFLMEKLQINDMQKMIDLLNNDSGLKGISGISPDMRDLIAARKTNPDAQLAIDVFINRIVKYVGSYIAEMHGLDVMVFTAGMGENNPHIRAKVMQNFEFLGMQVDHESNDNGQGARIITTPNSKIKGLVVPTDEELMIAREFERLVQSN
ncbi:acetate kinase [Bombilactobacillus folatiphilus]|uniref:Acetate kinase n=1 Tax=Bombilactobacillus folatiphilus TaxID=2923362 RepID=A0ABY4PBA5_9LACO|nr:acetate kinase [Bombilactobacillus folatiphilus]UQS82867.1 acetate kinase [Bombilactobacillus folatiphilus]